MNRIIFLILLTCTFSSCKNQLKDNPYQSLDTELKNSLNRLAKTKKKTLKTVPSNRIISMTDSVIIDTNFLASTSTFKHTSYTDDLPFYTRIISSKKIDKVQIFEEKYSKTELTYLGQIKDLSTQELFHVIREFGVVGLNGGMLSPRGHSKIIFSNSRKTKLWVYRLGCPDELPVQIDENKLIFHFESNTIKLSISGGLGALFCIPTISCY